MIGNLQSDFRIFWLIFMISSIFLVFSIMAHSRCPFLHRERKILAILLQIYALFCLFLRGCIMRRCPKIDKCQICYHCQLFSYVQLYILLSLFVHYHGRWWTMWWQILRKRANFNSVSVAVWPIYLRRQTFGLAIWRCWSSRSHCLLMLSSDNLI